MKRYIYIALLLASSFLFVRCDGKNDDEGSDAGQGNRNENYTSYWYYSYGAVGAVTHETMGFGSADEFNPYTVAHRGDTLFVANTAGGHSIILFDKKRNTPLGILREWTDNGQTRTFQSRIDAMAMTDERLYAAGTDSRIHVFALPDLEYITCVGNGNYWDAVFQVQALAVKDGLLYARDKDGGVSIYKEEDIRPGNYAKRYKKTSKASSNNGFNPHYMEVCPDGNIALTDYEWKCIRVLDTSLVTDQMQGGTSIDIEERKLSIEHFKPRTFARLDGRLYVTGDNLAVNIYDLEKNEWLKTLHAVKDFDFGNPERIYTDGDILWVSDINKKKLVKMTAVKCEIREYTQVTDNIVRVEKAATRGGEHEVFYVDITTHEIVDSFAE
jgi:hypothetical protein